MRFAACLRESLQVRASQAPVELTRGDSLENVLTRHLLAVEQSVDGDLFASVLLLSPDGKRLSHGAAPNLPKAYRDAIDGSEIGPCAGSCGTAAFLGRPVYVSDIATDPLWDDYRHLALPHGFRSCWSTPIRDTSGAVIGTFAIYHPTVGTPSPQEVEAIAMIAGQVAHAIMWDRAVGALWTVDADSEPTAADGSTARLMQQLAKLELLATEMKARADAAECDELRMMMMTAAIDCRRLISLLRHRLDPGS
jgi:GAF domain-containing protein